MTFSHRYNKLPSNLWNTNPASKFCATNDFIGYFEWWAVVTANHHAPQRWSLSFNKTKVTLNFLFHCSLSSDCQAVFFRKIGRNLYIEQNNYTNQNVLFVCCLFFNWVYLLTSELKMTTEVRACKEFQFLHPISLKSHKNTIFSSI